MQMETDKSGGLYPYLEKYSNYISYLIFEWKGNLIFHKFAGNIYSQALRKMRHILLPSMVSNEKYIFQNTRIYLIWFLIPTEVNIAYNLFLFSSSVALMKNISYLIILQLFNIL